MTLAQNLQADDHGNSQGRMVAGVTVIGDEKAHGSNLRRSNLSARETIVPSETLLDPVPEDDDPDVLHRGWRDEVEAAKKTGKPYWTLCGKLVYIIVEPYPKACPACAEVSARLRGVR